ncbi:MAG: 4-(cytidine 5'-diphospho)-2-C-methyl-D-erythritol kinase, partial [Rhizobiaceae bacterium]
VFSTLDQKNNPPLPDSGTPWLDHLPDLRNDLQPAALQLAPIIGDCLKSLEGFDACRLARMSGSGATCFGLFETADEAQSAAAELRRRHPDWWVADTKTIG